MGAGLIIAIGAQNAFVLRQGLKGRHAFATAAVCALCDLALIALGVGGLGTVVASSDALAAAATWGGAAFLFLYGLRSFRSAARPGVLVAEVDATAPTGLRAAALTALTALALSLLNPHVYLDTVVLIGSVGARYPGVERLAFAVGAAVASLAWFFGLAYGATRLTPLFSSPRAWRVLDVFVGCVMWAIGASLAWGAVA